MSAIVSILIAFAAGVTCARSEAPPPASPVLAFAERVACERAIARVYHRHRLWPAANAAPRPPFERAVPQSASAERVRRTLQRSVLLDRRWHSPITPADLQAEIRRLVRNSRRPGMLREVIAALGDDPARVAECLARPLLAERRARSFFSGDREIHGPQRARIEAELRRFADVDQMRLLGGSYREQRWPRATADRLGLGEGRMSELLEDETGYSVHAVLRIDGDEALVATVRWSKVTLDEWIDTQDIPAQIEALPAYTYELPALPAAAESAGAPEGEWTPTAAVPEGVDGLSTVWTGSEVIVWGGSKRDTGAIYDPATDAWFTIAEVGAPAPRLEHVAVWTGKELVVWGGCGQIGNFCELADGGRYDPVTNSWRPITATGAPPPRRRFAGVWTGRELVVWGGCRTGAFGNNACEIELGDGGRYDPESDTWRPMTTTGAPSPRTDHTAVWSGSEMIVWGGTPNLVTNTGGRYDPAEDRWLPVTTAGAPAARANHTAVWSGDEMIIWGGCDNAVCAAQSTRFGDGARYDPETDSWSPVSSAGAPSARANHVAVWTGNEMLVWGGRNASGAAATPGGRYDPVADSWLPMSAVGEPPPAEDAVWTGTEMFVWGNQEKTGGRYDPALDTWLPVNNTDPGEARRNAASVWTGAELLVWSGDAVPDGLSATGDRYDPVTDTWAPMSEIGQPVQRERGATAVWTGSEMIVWGGQTGTRIYDTGGRYDPVTDTWRPTSTLGAPAPRTSHTAVWTGSRMVVWGGDAGGTTNTGGRYDPLTDSWSPTTTAGAPAARRFHSAVWADGEMIVWGGLGAGG
ncbi:MAG: hypothetical protein D6738_13375, partial [Acidobacteria bacterium]